MPSPAAPDHPGTGLLIVGAQRQRVLEQAMRTGAQHPLSFRIVGVFTAGGVVVAVMTVSS